MFERRISEADDRERTPSGKVRGPARRWLLGLAALAWALPAPADAPARRPAIDNSRFLFAPEDQLNDDARRWTALDPGLRGREVELRHWAAYWTVHPKLLAALLAFDRRQRLGDQPAITAAAIEKVAAALADDFYRFYAARGTDEREHAATLALALHFGSLDDARTWERLDGFLRWYAVQVPGQGDLASPNRAPAAPGDALPPADFLWLPYRLGHAWFFGGTHRSGIGAPNANVRTALDFHNGHRWGDDTTQALVTASHDGTVVVHSSCYLTVHGADGWSTVYYHLGAALVSHGSFVSRGTPIAYYADNLDQALCNGGGATGPHVHWALLRDGAYASIAGAWLSGYRVHDGRYDYDTDCDYFYMERDGVRFCAFDVPLLNDGRPGVPDVPVAVAVSAPDAAAGEASDHGLFRLQRSGSLSSALEVSLAVEGSAAAGADYRPLPASVAIPAGTATVDLALEVLDDGVAEAAETVTLRVVGGPSYVAGSPAAATITLADDDRPTAPSGLVALPGGVGEIGLAWSAQAEASFFRVERRQEGGAFIAIGDAPAGATAFLDGAVVSGVTYGYRVAAGNAAGLSAYSNEAVATAAGESPPGELTAIAIEGERVELRWTDASGGRASFEIESRFAALDQPFAPAGIAPIGASRLIVSGLVPDVDYLFRIRSRGGQGDSTPSTAVGVRTLVAPAAPCQEGAGSTCLGGERFEVSALWRDFQGQRGRAKAVAAPSAEAGLFYFFSADNWELLVKVLDGCALNDRHWVFAAATTNVEYTLIVTDRLKGRSALYANTLGATAPAIADTGAFAGCPATPAPIAIPAELPGVRPGSVEEGACVAGEETACLNGARFAVGIGWRDFAGQQGRGRVVPFGTDNSGLFTFFSPDNWEVLVKVLDGCAINGHFWVLAAGTTTVEYDLDVADTLRPELAPQRYHNPLGQNARAVIDTAAFPCSLGTTGDVER